MKVMYSFWKHIRHNENKCKHNLHNYIFLTIISGCYSHRCWENALKYLIIQTLKLKTKNYESIIKIYSWSYYLSQIKWIWMFFIHFHWQSISRGQVTNNKTCPKYQVCWQFEGSVGENQTRICSINKSAQDLKELKFHSS